MAVRTVSLLFRHQGKGKPEEPASKRCWRSKKNLAIRSYLKNNLKSLTINFYIKFLQQTSFGDKI
jgi:hypothetical protein